MQLTVILRGAGPTGDTLNLAVNDLLLSMSMEAYIEWIASVAAAGNAQAQQVLKMMEEQMT